MVVPIAERIVELPDGVSANIAEDGTIRVQGPNGQLERKLRHPRIDISVGDEGVVIRSVKARREIAALVGTFNGHISNMVQGVQEDFEAKCKAVNAHFPIKMKVDGDTVLIENFLGEKAARRAPIRPGCKVQVKGSDVIITGPDKEAVGQTAANLEAATKITRRDRRVFQDGVYIVEKP